MKLFDSRARNNVHAVLLCAVGSVLLSLSSPSKAALAISGTPPSTVTVSGNRYWFAPMATDTNTSAARIGWVIYNKPAWLQFDGRSGHTWGSPHPQDVGTYRNIIITASDDHGAVSTRPFSITVVDPSATQPGTSSAALTLVGHAPTAVNVGTAYTFSPTASDPTHAQLSFSIKNKPKWANFSTTSGTLSGTPAATDLGTYANIQISVSDGQASAALPAFTIAVGGQSASNAVLDWTPATANVDGSALTNLAGYRVHYGTSPDMLTDVIDLPNPGLTSYVVDNLTTGTWYFAMTSYSTSGQESARTGIVSTTIR